MMTYFALMLISIVSLPTAGKIQNGKEDGQREKQDVHDTLSCRLALTFIPNLSKSFVFNLVDLESQVGFFTHRSKSQRLTPN